MSKRIFIPLAAVIVFSLSYWYWSAKPPLGGCFENAGGGYARPVNCPAPPPWDPASWMLLAACMCLGAMVAGGIQDFVENVVDTQRCPHIGCGAEAADHAMEGISKKGKVVYVSERCKKCKGLMMWSNTLGTFVRWNDDVKPT